MKYQVYPEYKDSGVEWLGEVPSHWFATKIKYGYEITLGKMLQKEARTFGEEFKPYLKAINIQSNGVSLDKIENMWFSQSEIKSLRLLNGDVLISEGGDVGRAAIWKDELPECYIQNAINRARPLKDRSSSYLYYWMNMLKDSEYIDVLCNKATIAHYTAEKLESSPLFIPSYKEAVLIANFLDHETAKIDTLIEKQQQLIQLLKEKRQAVISHAVTKGLNPDAPMRDSGVEWLGEVPAHWHVWKFAHFAPIITCGIASTPEYVDEENGMPFLSAQNVQANKLQLHKYNHIPHELHRQLTKYRRPERGDLLVTRVGAGIGDACVIDVDMEFSIYVSLTHIRVNPDISCNKFIMYFFGSDYCKYLNYQGTVTGGGVGNLNVQNVMKYLVPLPAIKEQNDIINYLPESVS